MQIHIQLHRNIKICKNSTLPALSVLSVATIALTVVGCLFDMIRQQAEASTGTGGCSGMSGTGSFIEYNSAVGSFIFAYCGQHIFLEMQAEMRQPADWPKAVASSFSTMFALYILVVSVAYQTCGDKTPDELLNVLDGNAFKSVIGIMMVLHLIVTYTIMQQVLTRAICLRLKFVL